MRGMLRTLKMRDYQFTVYVKSRCALFQTTGRLKIGTYTGPLQHGIVYSGGKTPGSLSHLSLDS